MPGARKNRVPAPNQHSDFPFRSVTSPERSIGRTVLRHTMSYTVGPHPSRAPWSTYRSPSHRKRPSGTNKKVTRAEKVVLRLLAYAADEASAPNLTSSPIPPGPPCPTDSQLFVFQRSCLCAAVPVEFIFGYGSRPGHNFEKKLLYFGIVFCRHASMGLPGWWFN